MLRRCRVHCDVAASHGDALAQLLTRGAQGIRTGSDATEAFNTDWLRKVRGGASLVLLPTTTDDVSRVLKYCHAHKLPVVPQGGNTGLVQGGVPRANTDEVVLSLAQMTAPCDISKGTMSANCGAGVVLETLQQAAKREGLHVPLDLGARGSCTIGGNVATNAGGLHFARYGSIRSNVLGLTAVLADGSVLDLATTNRKDNTGYDLKQFFVGSEGTLGVVTQVNLKLYPAPRSSTVAVIALPSFDAVLAAFDAAQRSLGPVLSAFEIMDAEGLTAVGSTVDGAAVPPGGFAALVEVHSAAECATDELARFTEALEAASVPLGATAVAGSAADEARLWTLREEHPVKLAAVARRNAGAGSAIYKYDLCFALDDFYRVVASTRDFVQRNAPATVDPSSVVVTGYGHFGDGNVHLNIVDTTGAAKAFILGPVGDHIYEATNRLGGSISAEHGIGVEKAARLAQAKPAAHLHLMRQVKELLDPTNILNPGKIFV